MLPRPEPEGLVMRSWEERRYEALRNMPRKTWEQCRAELIEEGSKQLLKLWFEQYEEKV